MSHVLFCSLASIFRYQRSFVNGFCNCVSPDAETRKREKRRRKVSGFVNGFSGLSAQIHTTVSVRSIQMPFSYLPPREVPGRAQFAPHAIGPTAPASSPAHSQRAVFLPPAPQLGPRRLGKIDNVLADLPSLARNFQPAWFSAEG